VYSSKEQSCYCDEAASLKVQLNFRKLGSTGKEGKKKNWQPWDCMRIIMENVGPGENHGCPFRSHLYLFISYTQRYT
jgi:hypothetical protein